jgi:hypothetical protein
MNPSVSESGASILLANWRQGNKASCRISWIRKNSATMRFGAAQAKLKAGEFSY